MLKGQSSNGEATHLPALVDPRLGKALGHVLRQHILLAATQDTVSPKELSKLFGEGLSQVSYHVAVLHKDCDEMLELVGTEPRRGAVEHFYRATAKTLLPAKRWRRLKKGMRAVIAAGLANDLFNDLADALKAKKLQGEHDYITRSLLVLDAEGRRNVKAIAARADKEVKAEGRAAAERLAKANGTGDKPTGYTFGLLAFEAAWEAADLRALAVEDEEGTSSAHKAKRGGRKVKPAAK